METEYEITDADGMIWDKLTEMAQSGDCRAMKLYYELLEKRKKNDSLHIQSVMQLGEIRRAVFGDGALLDDLAKTTAVSDGAGFCDALMCGGDLCRDRPDTDTDKTEENDLCEEQGEEDAETD